MVREGFYRNHTQFGEAPVNVPVARIKVLACKVQGGGKLMASGSEGRTEYHTTVTPRAEAADLGSLSAIKE
jgi:hypothetical protein